MKKISPDNSSIHEKNSGHVSDSSQHFGAGTSLSKLKAKVLPVYRSHGDMIDVAKYTKATVQTDHGVYEAIDCEKRHTERQKPDQSSTSKLYGADCRFEGDVCDIKGSLDENEDALQLRTSDREE